MAYNNYGGYYGYPQYNSMSYQQYQQPMVQQQMQQQMVQPQTQSNDIPFAEVLFGTLKEAEARIVTPNRSVCFVNNAMGEIYVKSADGMGNPSFKTYKLVTATNNSQETQTNEFDPKNFVKSEDLKGFITKNDLKDFLTITDFDQIMQEIDRLKKRMQINEIEKKGDVKNAK